MRLLIIALFVGFLSSCGDKVEREMLPGRYVFTHWTKDTIDIKYDGTYEHFIFADGKRIVNSGTWKLNSTGNEIKFENFSDHSRRSNGNWFARLRVKGQEIHLMYADDINAYYNRVDEIDSLK